MSRTSKVVSSSLALLLFLFLVSLALFAASYLEHHPALQSTVLQLGYPGILAIATIAGLNIFVPVPAASLVPLFTTAGLYLPFIVICLTIGTVLADFIGYRFGRCSSSYVHTSYPKQIKKLEYLHTKHKMWLVPMVFLYAAFAPFPNEAIILPLAIIGVRFRVLILPLLLGNLINQTIYAIGIQNVFWWLF